MSEFGEGLFADFRPGSSNNKSVEEQTIAGKVTSTTGCLPTGPGSFMDLSQGEDVGASSVVRLQRKRRRPALACGALKALLAQRNTCSSHDSPQ